MLDRTTDEQEAPDWPLAVLGACETDLSKRDHDEALTLTTAFVVGGARDVAGSRWATQDSAAALMTALCQGHPGPSAGECGDGARRSGRRAVPATGVGIAHVEDVKKK
ncbi:CHAT domain-containing protein [Streptomyces sp. AB3(2024)]|uniref:CHAT domain-containing protein n=1 Tax=Streptomyces sp. AB3(2024) TaxID=3317321 RepID=UPI0035A3B4AB